MKIQLPDNDFDDSIEHPIHEEVERICYLAVEGHLYGYEAAEKIIETFRKYLLNHNI